MNSINSINHQKCLTRGSSRERVHFKNTLFAKNTGAIRAEHNKSTLELKQYIYKLYIIKYMLI